MRGIISGRTAGELTTDDRRPTTDDRRLEKL
jgi:hypothetical protein